MTKYYNKQDLKTATENQVRVYKDLAAALRAVIPALLAMDGKVINIKLERAVEALLPEGITASLKDTYGYQKRIELWTCHRHFETWAGHTGYVDNGTASFDFAPGRLDAAAAIADAEKWANYYDKEAAELLAGLARLDEIEAEYNRICGEIKAFNDATPYQIRESYKFNAVY